MRECSQFAVDGPVTGSISLPPPFVVIDGKCRDRVEPLIAKEGRQVEAKLAPIRDDVLPARDFQPFNVIRSRRAKGAGGLSALRQL